MYSITTKSLTSTDSQQKGTEFEKVQIIKKSTDFGKKRLKQISQIKKVSLEIEGYKFEPQNHLKVTSGILSAPKNVQITDKKSGSLCYKNLPGIKYQMQIIMK